MNKERIKRKLEFYNESFSIKLLKLSQRNLFKIKILQNLKISAGRFFEPNQWDICRKPDELDMNIDGFVFYDIVFFEEFVKMKNSLSKLSQLCGDDKFLKINKKLDEWHFKINENPAILGNNNLGYYDFSGFSRIKYLKGAQIYLLHISPSIVVLSISVNVNEHFKEKFEKLISSEPLPFFKITKIDIGQGFIGWERRPGLYRRRIQINELVYLIQSEIKYIRKKYLTFGNYNDISFPSLQVFSTQNSLELLVKKEKEKTFYKFFDSIGFDLSRAYYDMNEKWFLISKNKISTYPFDHIVVCSEADYKKSDQSSYAMMLAIFNDYSNELSSILALNSYLSILRQKIMQIRNYVNPILLKKWIVSTRIKKSFRIRNMITNLDYKLERIFKEIDEPTNVFHLFTDLDNIKRKVLEKEYYFKQELLSGYNYLINENKNYLDFIKSSFNDFISFRTMHYNYKIQSKIFWLTVLIIIVSVILLFPEKDRIEFFSRIINYVRNNFNI